MLMSPGRTLGFIATLLACSFANAQSDKSLPGCEPPRELRIAMRIRCSSDNCCNIAISLETAIVGISRHSLTFVSTMEASPFAFSVSPFAGLS